METLVVTMRLAGSPVSDDGCGLKQLWRGAVNKAMTVRPSAMTGVD